MGSTKSMAAEPAGTSYPQQNHMDAANKLLGMGALSFLQMPKLRGASQQQHPMGSSMDPYHLAVLQSLLAPRPQAPQPAQAQPYEQPFQINA